MKFTTLVTLAALAAAASSCTTFADGDRYGGGRQDGRNGTSFSHLEGTPDGKPQRTGWFTSMQTREAEKRSIADDIPYGVVNPKGTVVTVP
jgi:hypothetical protein